MSHQLAYLENWGKVEPVMERFGKLGILPHTKPNAIGMWPNEQECLVWSALQCNPNQLWVEVGSFCGGSTILLGYAQDSIDGDGGVMAIDLAFNPMFDYNIKRSKLVNIDKKEGSSLELLSQANEPISFLFLDGWHSFKSVVEEFQAIQDMLTDDTIIGFHDVSPKMLEHDDNHVQASYNYIKQNSKILFNEKTQDFRLDEAVAYICTECNYRIIDIPVRKHIEHFRETGLDRWVRGTTSPHNSFTAIRKEK